MEAVKEKITNVGVYLPDERIFESQYDIPNGMAYNSYLIEDDHIAVVDSVDAKAGKEWLENIREVLKDKKPEYLIVQHLEPDHSASIGLFLEEYPEAKLVMSAKAASMFPQFSDMKNEILAMKEGETLDLGKHHLTFYTAPMVHWPEVMVSYNPEEKILFSADAFGSFGDQKEKDDWDDEARRYYFNIVGKYGKQAAALLKKAAGLDIEVIAPLHGPVLTENLSHYLEKYDQWANYTPEVEGVFIPVASIYGNTKKAALKFAEMLRERGCPNVKVMDIVEEDVHEAVAQCFKYPKIVFAASSYDGLVFEPMQRMINILEHKAFQNRQVGLIENGSWAPSAARTMKSMLESCKGIELVEPVVTIKTRHTEKNLEELKELAEHIWPE